MGYSDPRLRIVLIHRPNSNFGMISLTVDPFFFECRQLCLNSHGVLKVRTGHESVTQSQPCWALPHQAKGSNTETRSSAHEQDVSTLTGTKKGYKSGNTNEDTATVASPLGHGPSASNRAMTILHSITSDLPTTWISGISCTISRS